MFIPRAVLAIVLMLGVFAPAVDAQARGAARDPAAAEVLFRDALAALDQGDWASACAKFQASMELDPAVSTLINIAKCHDHEGKIATAWAELNQALVLNGETVGKHRKADLDQYAKALIAKLEPRLPKLTIVVRDKPAGLEVTRDGLKISSEVVGEALPVDPGPHEIMATAPGYTTDKHTVDVAKGKAVTVEMVLVAATAKGPVAAPKAPGWVLWGVGAVGLASLGAGIGFMVDYIRVRDDVTANCPPPEWRCYPGRYANQEALDVPLDRWDRSFGLALGLGGLGLLGVGTTTIGLVTKGRGAPLGRSAWVPWVSPSGVGIYAKLVF